MSNINNPYLGSRISLISKAKIRYEGILYAIDTDAMSSATTINPIITPMQMDLFKAKEASVDITMPTIMNIPTPAFAPELNPIKRKTLKTFYYQKYFKGKTTFVA